MISTTALAGGARRVLLFGPVFSAEEMGGLQVALADVAEQLGARGWQVDTRIWAAPQAGAVPSAAVPGWASTAPPPRHSMLDRLPKLYAGWTRFVPSGWRQLISLALKPPAYFATLSRNLRVAEALLPEARRCDVVLLCINGAPPGLAALLTERLDNLVILSLDSLADELKSAGYRWERLAARRHGTGVHPYLYRPVAPGRVRLAIFASAAWQAQAVRAGLPAERARTIYFGVPQVAPQPRPAAVGHRILAVGRMAPDKGLHQLVRAMPAIRRHVPDATLDIIAGPGPAGYRDWLLQLIQARGLEGAVRILPSRERAALQTAYARHDVLFFYSKFAEPVALVLMEAFAAGLPVVASQAQAPLVRDGLTCVCYEPYDTDGLARAMVRMLSDPDFGRQLASNAQRLVQQDFSLKKMGREYDAALREFLAQDHAAPTAVAQQDARP